MSERLFLMVVLIASHSDTELVLNWLNELYSPQSPTNTVNLCQPYGELDKSPKSARRKRKFDHFAFSGIQFTKFIKKNKLSSLGNTLEFPLNEVSIQSL